MHWKKILGICTAGLLSLPGAVSAGEKLVFVPLDNRPVSLAYTADSFRKAGYQVVTPPAELLASDRQQGKPKQLEKWLEKEIPGSIGTVVSADTLIYGGLTGSRTHELPSGVLAKRTQSLLNLKKKFPFVPVYAFATIMRSPRYSAAPAEPAYYAQYGPQIFRWGELRDRQELQLLNKKETQELEQLEKTLPQEVQTDVLSRRSKNLRVLEQLAQGIPEGRLDYLVIGRDDSAPFSEAHRDARAFFLTTGNVPSYKLRSFSGTDELGMLMLNRAVNRSKGVTPLVYAYYTGGTGGRTVPSYEDGTIRQSYRQHVLAAGGYPALLDKNADLVLGIYTPVNGITAGADTDANTSRLDDRQESFLAKTRRYVDTGRNVGLADINVSNGGSNGLVKHLLTARQGKTPLGWELGSYAGWNTAGNSLGYALGQGLLRQRLSDQNRKDLLTVRYLDDWLYQSKVRQEVRQQLIYPKGYPDGTLTDQETLEAQQFIAKAMPEAGKKYFAPQVWQAYTYTLPWHRTFEVYVKPAAKPEARK